MIAAAAIWEDIKKTLQPVIEPLKAVAVVLLMFTGLPEIYAIINYGPQIIAGWAWRWLLDCIKPPLISTTTSQTRRLRRLRPAGVGSEDVPRSRAAGVRAQGRRSRDAGGFAMVWPQPLGLDVETERADCAEPGHELAHDRRDRSVDVEYREPLGPTRDFGTTEAPRSTHAVTDSRARSRG